MWTAVYMTAGVLGAGLIYSLWNYLFSARGKFWRAVNRDPAFAIALFEQYGCLFDEQVTPANRRTLVGPFSVPGALPGVVHKVYIPRDAIETIQIKMMADFTEAERIRKITSRMLSKG